MKALDLFAGPGGWDYAATELGIDVWGIELDEAAVETRKAAGVGNTVHGDVAAQDPASYPDFDLLIASPPCQAWSMAGKRGGERDKQHVVACALEIAAGNDTRSDHAAKCEDSRSMLVVEPLRWALALKPRRIALEQVPPVLELWTLFAGLLEAVGYRTWAGVLSAERYGVPQTRKRAILMASLDGPVAPPEPTHQAYEPGVPAQAQHGLFGSLLPWVSMAEALGWDSQDVYRSNYNNGSTLERNERGAGDPGLTVTGKVNRDFRYLRAGTNENDIARPVEEPAPTIRYGERMNDVSWIGFGWNPRQNGGTVRDGDEPAPAMLGEGLAKGVPVWDDERKCPEAGPNAVRVTEREAAILQGFPRTIRGRA